MSVRDVSSHLTSPVGGLDAAVGVGLDAATAAWHRRRLRRHGWEWALDARVDPQRQDGWWVPGVPVREGNEVEVLVDGSRIVPRIVELLDAARSHVHLAAWHASPDFRMGQSGPALRDLLARTAERVPTRLLMWAGAPVPVFPPSRAHVDTDTREFRRDSRLEVALDRHERPMHCHHEKVIIVDDEVAVVGGLDLTHLQGDRLDTPDHPKVRELGWHDAALVVRGPIVADVARHVSARWNEVTGQHLPDAAPQSPAGEVALQMLRTVPNGVYDFLPDGEFTPLAAYLMALRAADHLIYLENQFLWSSEVVEVLLDKLQHPPNPDFRMLLVLPRKPSSGRDTTCGQLARLIAADAGRGHLLAVTVLAPTADATGVYVHAKIGIVDDRWLTVGSANLNEHSLFNDTEMNLLTLQPDLARRTRIQLWSEHLQLPETDLQGDAAQLVDTVWVSQCDVEGPVSAAHQDPVHRIRRIAGLSRRVDRLRGPLEALVVDG